MTITYIEPFYSGSHKQFTDQLIKHSRHKIDLLSLEGKFWKWRMYGGATSLGHQFIEKALKPDLIITTDMLDLPTFLSITRKSLSTEVPIVCYFHENQMAYPWKADSKDKQDQRDHHYAMMNYHTAMAADYNLFNSAYNMNSLYDGLESLLKKMPDHQHLHYLEDLRHKSQVMPLGLELNEALVESKQDDPRSDLPLILWNHRWQHDKNPEAFFEALEAVRANGGQFQLAVLGESYKRMPKIFEDVPEDFFRELIHFGYASYHDYLALLNKADILPVTSIHEFFGISVMEAIHCGARPLLPKRLSYVELYQPELNPELFYDTQEDLVNKLTALCKDFKKTPRDHFRGLTQAYDWARMIDRYDDFFQSMLAPSK